MPTHFTVSVSANFKHCLCACLCVLGLLSVISLTAAAFDHTNYYPYAEGAVTKANERWSIRANAMVGGVNTAVQCDTLVQTVLLPLYRPNNQVLPNAGGVLGVAVTLEGGVLHAYFASSGRRDTVANLQTPQPQAAPIPNANWHMVRWDDVSAFADKLPAFVTQRYPAPLAPPNPGSYYEKGMNGYETLIKKVFTPNPKRVAILNGQPYASLTANKKQQHDALAPSLTEGGSAVGVCALAKLALYLSQTGKTANVQCVAETVIGNGAVSVRSDNGNTAHAYATGTLIPSCVTCQKQVRDIMTGRYTTWVQARKRLDARAGPLKRSNSIKFAQIDPDGTIELQPQAETATEVEENEHGHQHHFEEILNKIASLSKRRKLGDSHPLQPN